MLQPLWIAAIAAILLFQPPSRAYEVDNVTCRFRTLKDSRKVLNDETNYRIAFVLSGAQVPSDNPMNHSFGLNPAPLSDTPDKDGLFVHGRRPLGTSGRPGCDRGVLEDLRSMLASSWMENLETWAEQSQDVDKCKADSPHVYSKISKWDLGVAALAGLGSSIRIGDHNIGTDKLSHFMTEGFQYFVNFDELKGDKTLPLEQIPLQQLEAIHAQGVDEEKGGYGLMATGIYSYADTMANFQGFTFWKQMIDGSNPYLKCENGKWVQKRKFDWADYINIGMDESLNCNQYLKPRMQLAVEEYTLKLTAKYGSPQFCPIDAKACAELVKNFVPRPMAQDLLHPACYKSGHPKSPATATDKPKSTHLPEATQ